MDKTKESHILMTLYAVRNKDGKWFRSKGYGGSEATWVDTISKAKIYPKIGQARARVSFFAKKYPQYGIPEIVELYVTTSKTIDETKRVKKAQAERERREVEYERKRAEWKLDQAKIDLEKAKKTVESLEKEKEASRFLSAFEKSVGEALSVSIESGDQ